MPPDSQIEPRVQRRTTLGRIRLDGKVSVRLATTPELMREAAALRYLAYRRQGVIEDRQDGLFSDDYDKLPACRTILAEIDGRVVAAVRTSLYDPTRPEFSGTTLTAFQPDLDDLAAGIALPGHSGPILEVSRLVRHPEFERDIHVVCSLLMGVGYMMLWRQARFVTASVRRSHIPFYRRFGFQQITPPRPQPLLDFTVALIAFVRGAQGDDADIRIMDEVTTDDPQYQSLIDGRSTPIHRRL